MNRWASAGVLDRLFEELQRQQLIRVKIEEVSLDSTIVKVHPGGTGALRKTDRSGLERLLRYFARPAFASERLSWVGHCWLAALIPPPRRHCHHEFAGQLVTESVPVSLPGPDPPLPRRDASDRPLH